ncbi:MAG: hypothetical protein M3443_01415, partial [Actinomycetota bacterium]|nr:hypothetical protein [Actinomycetota bacterium]
PRRVSVWAVGDAEEPTVKEMVAQSDGWRRLSFAAEADTRKNHQKFRKIAKIPASTFSLARARL